MKLIFSIHEAVLVKFLFALYDNVCHNQLTKKKRKYFYKF